MDRFKLFLEDGELADAYRSSDFAQMIRSMNDQKWGPAPVMADWFEDKGVQDPDLLNFLRRDAGRLLVVGDYTQYRRPSFRTVRHGDEPETEYVYGWGRQASPLQWSTGASDVRTLYEIIEHVNFMGTPVYGDGSACRARNASVRIFKQHYAGEHPGPQRPFFNLPAYEKADRYCFGPAVHDLVARAANLLKK